ncbi:Alpha/Beta hydrolase protein [Polychytrium aggregatum]|uniref:Alpha/Beta hydrolase protein n=1 Tax=Polychytrium aggregatum TaxID=110093 RepID=UPI0022FE08AC|nr:Alpha/Beta hydrolase protein [Polychytrium aggregatum]KAI9206976.1 Alpha/Beta hydrolase protein [Polychytrium aggregatum]
MYFISLLFALLILFYVGLLAAVVAFPELQPYLIYLHWVRWPIVEDWRYADAFGFRDGSVRLIRITTPDLKIIGGWHILPTELNLMVSPESDIARGASYLEPELNKSERFDNQLKRAVRVFLYFHGNAGNRATFSRPDFYKQLTAVHQGSHVVTIDYRGFGDSERVTPTEAGMQQDAHAAYKWIVDHGVDPSRIIVVGHSLGTGVATWLCRTLADRGEAVGGLILLAPYKSIPDAALTYPIVPFLWPFRGYPQVGKLFKEYVSQKWDSTVNIRSINCPLLIVHGGRDFEIPTDHSRTLFLNAVNGRLAHQKSQPEPLNIHPAEPQVVGDYEIRPISGGREAYLWTLNETQTPLKESSMPDQTQRSSGVKQSSLVWYIEVTYGGHNNLHKFEIVKDGIAGWAQSHRI